MPVCPYARGDEPNGRIGNGFMKPNENAVSTPRIRSGAGGDRRFELGDRRSADAEIGSAGGRARRTPWRSPAPSRCRSPTAARLAGWPRLLIRPFGRRLRVHERLDRHAARVHHARARDSGISPSVQAGRAPGRRRSSVAIRSTLTSSGRPMWKLDAERRRDLVGEVPADRCAPRIDAPQQLALVPTERLAVVAVRRPGHPLRRLRRQHRAELVEVADVGQRRAADRSPPGRPRAPRSWRTVIAPLPSCANSGQYVATGRVEVEQPAEWATAIAVAAMPLVVEKTVTSVSRSHGWVRFLSRCPPQRSTTGWPSMKTAHAAPTSLRRSKFSRKRRPPAPNPGSTSPPTGTCITGKGNAGSRCRSSRRGRRGSRR